jgi:hypothetical protein
VATILGDEWRTGDLVAFGRPLDIRRFRDHAMPVA